MSRFLKAWLLTVAMLSTAVRVASGGDRNRYLDPPAVMWGVGLEENRRFPVVSGYSVAALDRAVQGVRERVGLQPGAILPEELFLRRAFLDTLGRPPRIGEWHRYVGDSSPDKRAVLAAELVLAPEYARHWARFWREVITYRVVDPDDHIEPEVLELWLAEQLHRGASWGEIASALIRAAGRSDTDGAANFILAHMARPAELASETARVFLGINIACAECHDDPNGPWTRRDFHGLAAFFARVEERRIDRQPPKTLSPDASPPPPIFEVIVTDVLQREYTMGSNSEDPASNGPVRPRWLNGAQLPHGLPDAQRRAALASWVTATTNPWFSRAYVNRIWTCFFGKGFAESPDDLGPGRPVHATTVLYSLASAWTRSGYNHRWLVSTILRSDVYARVAAEMDHPLAALTGVLPRRLTAYQLWNCLCTALDVAEHDIPESVRQVVDRVFGLDPSESRVEVVPSVDQTLFLMNHPTVQTWIRRCAEQLLVERRFGTRRPEDNCEELFVRVLSRRPTAKETQAVAEYVERYPDSVRAWTDVLWAVINSSEFLHVP
jgi:hypothetical protein